MFSWDVIDLTQLIKFEKVTTYVKVLYFTYTSIRPDFKTTIRSSCPEICITPYGGEAGYQRSVFNILMFFTPDVNSVFKKRVLCCFSQLFWVCRIQI